MMTACSHLDSWNHICQRPAWRIHHCSSHHNLYTTNWKWRIQSHGELNPGRPRTVYRIGASDLYGTRGTSGTNVISPPNFGTEDGKSGGRREDGKHLGKQPLCAMRACIVRHSKLLSESADLISHARSILNWITIFLWYWTYSLDYHGKWSTYTHRVSKKVPPLNSL